MIRMIQRLISKFSLPDHITKKEVIDSYFAKAAEFRIISLVQTYGGEVRCEVEDHDGVKTQLGRGVDSVGIYIILQASRAGVEPPEYLMRNE